MIYLLHTCDLQHSKNSKRLVAACTSKSKAIRLAKEDFNQFYKAFHNVDTLLKNEAATQLETNGQTQGLCNEFEYILEEIKTNELL